MSPVITQTKPCPKCLNDANLTGWKPPAGYDPHLRQYLCSKGGNKFYVRGGDKSIKLEALPFNS